MFRTRLDSVVRLRERDEDTRAQELGRAETAAAAAAQREAEARATCLRDARAGGDATGWLVAEEAHQRALVEAKRAAQESAVARRQADGARERYRLAHQRAEVVRRAVDHRREAARAEAERAEDKALDELVVLRFARQAAD